ncbi:tRNA synthetases class I (M)-domain-containing protein, partial [Suillus tomentosus]
KEIRVADDVLRFIPDPSQGAVLPKDGETNILITSTLPYCNNVPHLGASDGLVQSYIPISSIFTGTRNRRTLYICATDEYGTATETAALKEGITSRELCDKYYALHKETYEWFDISFDLFGHTSTAKHTESP